MKSPVVSVTMPCYNCAETVGTAVESILNQSFEDFELVAVDDGSTDSTASVLKGYAEKDSRIRPVFIEHRGVVGAANAALSASSGRFVARMDADDYSLPDRLACQVDFLNKNPEIGLTACLVNFGGDRKKNFGYACYVDWINTLVTHEEISLHRFVEFPFANPSIMMRRELLDKYGAFREGDFPEDYELVLRFLESGVRMEKVRKELFVWNDPPGRLSRNHPKYSVDSFYRIKSEYLYRWLESGNALHPEVIVLGSSRLDRKRASILENYGVNIKAYVDINPDKIGKVVSGKPVISLEDIPKPGKCFLLSYVATRGARDKVASFLNGKGYAMGRDYLLVA
ncbi:glycosyltransferase family 2 protein [Maridesulfovibrio bastinii]|uniref:glycosyltransferase family 2 protein n=1 Tax=Maridesulfovibrio bastinii TaxID=47157 RepID=UPI000428A45D|nr:glycosyltransferase [Maridesulfovibrio bastinii]